MKGVRKIFLSIVVVTILLGSVFFLKIFPRAVEVEEFKESYEMWIQIDTSGTASGRHFVQLAPSKLASTLKFVVSELGTKTTEQSYREWMCSYFTRYGLETRELECRVTVPGKGENLKITTMWQTSCFAKRVDNGWTITLGWIDNLVAAEETINETAQSLTFVRNISKNARYISSGKTSIFLPPEAENVIFPLADSSQKSEYGGGSYDEVSWYVENIHGRIAIVEHSHSVITTEEITITPEHLLENYFYIWVKYGGVRPENVSLFDSIDQIRLDLKYGRKLRTNYIISHQGSEFALSPAQILYHVADAIVTIDRGGKFSIEPIAVAPPGEEKGDFGASWRKLSKGEYVNLAQAIRDEIESTSKAPSTIENTPIGKIRFRDILYTFARVLCSYGNTGGLPEEIAFAPVPSERLNLNGATIAAKYAYFLLPETYVLTNTAKVNSILPKLYESGYDNEEYTRKLCEWVHSEITYTFKPTPIPTSEKVLERKMGQCRDYANVYLALLRTARVPSRRVSGWVIYTRAWRPPSEWKSIVIGETPDGRTIGSHAWTQAYLPDKGWVSVDPTEGAFETLPYEIYKEMPQSWMSALAAYETAYGLI